MRSATPASACGGSAGRTASNTRNSSTRGASGTAPAPCYGSGSSAANPDCRDMRASPRSGGGDLPVAALLEEQFQRGDTPLPPRKSSSAHFPEGPRRRAQDRPCLGRYGNQSGDGSLPVGDLDLRAAFDGTQVFGEVISQFGDLDLFHGRIRPRSPPLVKSAGGGTE